MELLTLLGAAVKSLDLFLHEILTECGDRCSISTIRDEKTITDRIKHEGLSFLTITLAAFGKDFEKSLDQGFVDHSLFGGFAFGASLPRFLGGFFDLVFDRGTGRLLDEPSIISIRSIRQITLMWAKIELPCTPERERAAYEKYIQCEQEVKAFDTTFPSYEAQFNRIGSLLWSRIFSDIERKVIDQTIVPKHGPGATADRIKGNQKYNQRVWTDRLESIFPMGRYAYSKYSSFLSDLDDGLLTFLEPGAEIPVRVITVPKTLKTPRIIAVEPTCMQYMQQALLAEITERISLDDSMKLVVGFDDQVPNQDLAREGSLTGSLATLDLSEASDRVSNQHVRSLLRYHPTLLEAVDACRSRKADVDGHGVIRLAKFASMGSALCFPFEAMVFATVIFMGIENVLNRQLSRKDIKSLLGKVRVYGDDIIVPVDYVRSVVEALEAFGFKVNSSKSFWTGKFRESCGKEYYAGSDVSIVKVRRELPTQRRHTQEIISVVSMRNQLFTAGYFNTCDWLDTKIERLIPFPYVLPDSPALGRIGHAGYQIDGHDPHLQRPFVKGMQVKVVLPSSPIQDNAALMKTFLKRGELPFADRNHLLYAGRSVSVYIKTRRLLPY